MESGNFGRIHFRAYAASEAIPIEGVAVRILNDRGEILYSLLTDEDGVTEAVSLPAPPVVFSLDSRSSDESFSLYEIEASKSGYYTKKIYNVPIFSGVETEMPINMIDYVSKEDGGLFPRGNVNAVINESY